MTPRSRAFAFEDKDTRYARNPLSFRGGLDVQFTDRGEILPVSTPDAHLFKQA
jgi:hypothetical protein